MSELIELSKFLHCSFSEAIRRVEELVENDIVEDVSEAIAYLYSNNI